MLKVVVFVVLVLIAVVAFFVAQNVVLAGLMALLAFSLAFIELWRLLDPDDFND